MELLLGNCLDRLKDLEDNSVDAIVTDPPYGLSFMGKKWDYDVPSVDIWKECLRVLKPGGYLLSFAGTRTQHRMAVNIEDAGFEIRDMIAWIYGSGFPKSRNIGKDVEKINVGGLKNLKQIGTKQGIKCETGTKGYSYNKEYVAGKCMGGKQISGEIPVYEINNEFEGWGTALKPALEPITVARKPIEKGLSVAENCLKWGVGGINIDGCRVEAQKGDKFGGGGLNSPVNGFMGNTENTYKKGTGFRDDTHIGRFPANLIPDGSQEVLDLFPQTKSGSGIKKKATGTANGIFNINKIDGEYLNGDSGSAARFFYCAKASKQDRDEGCEEIVAKTWKDQGFRDNETTHLSPRAGAGRTSLLRNNHPTVKPTSLMRYLCRLVTPPDGTILNPFMGSGSTGKAAALEGFRFIGIELEKEYTAIAEKRIMSAQPLFAGVNA